MRTGEGQRVLVSMLGALLRMRGSMWTAMTDPDEWCGFHLDNYTRPPDHGYKTKDGHVYFGLRRGSSEDWDCLLISLSMAEALNDPRFAHFGCEATSIIQEIKRPTAGRSTKSSAPFGISRKPKRLCVLLHRCRGSIQRKFLENWALIRLRYKSAGEPE